MSGNEKRYGFGGKLRKQGNSLIITIPAETRKLALMEEGKTYQFEVVVGG